MSRAPLRLGTRRSPMAVAQSQLVGRAITARTGREVELVGIDSAGDRSRELLTQIGGTGVFVSALRSSLLAGEVDIAVHSLKDLPVGPAAGIALAAVPGRDDPRDALVGRDGAKLADLPAGARIGTGSPRRAAQLLLLRPDIHPVPVRGNAGHTPGEGRDRRAGRRRSRPRGAGQDRQARRGVPGFRAGRDAAGGRPGRARG